MAMSGWRNVDYIGFVDRDKIRSTLASASVGMVTLMPTPSYIDALPVKMFEYMAMGVPVVASNFPVYSKVVEGADCGLCVDPANPAAIRAAILRILSNPLRATEMGQNGRRAVEAHYNWEREEQSLLAVYREMTGD